MVNFFNLKSYYNRLKTQNVGRPCLYFDTVDSTINVAKKEEFNTLVIAKEQTSGRGQRTNKWVSPIGCAMVSVRLGYPKGSFMTKRLCFLQHIVAISIAKTLECINPNRLGPDQIGLKWPNDIIYKERSLKIGGILVQANDLPDHHDVIISFGLNVSNREPTTCINEIISEPVSIDSVVADIMNSFENYTHELTDQKFETLKLEYEKRCIQVNKIVLDEVHGTISVKGVNNEGYLIGVNTMTGKPCTVTKII